MTDSKTVSVSILDKEYQVACAANEVAALQRSAHYLDEKMREMKANSNVFGLDRLAVMAALNITNELLAKEESAALADSQGQEIAKLNSKMDEALTRLRTPTVHD